MNRHQGPAVCLIVGALVLLQGCALGSVRLTQPGGDPDGWFGMTFSEVGPGDHRLITNEVNLCLDRPGTIEVVDVTLSEVEGGLFAEDFAIRPAAGRYPDVEDDAQTLADVGFVPGARNVTTVCPANLENVSLDDVVHLGIQFSKPGTATARGSGLEVHYTVDGGASQIFDVPFGLVLCEEQTTDAAGELTEDCDHIEDDYYRRDE